MKPFGGAVKKGSSSRMFIVERPNFTIQRSVPLVDPDKGVVEGGALSCGHEENQKKHALCGIFVEPSNLTYELIRLRTKKIAVGSNN